RLRCAAADRRDAAARGPRGLADLLPHPRRVPDAHRAGARVPARPVPQRAHPRADHARRPAPLRRPLLLDLVRDPDRAARDGGPGRAHRGRAAGGPADRGALSRGRHPHCGGRPSGRSDRRLQGAARIRRRQRVTDDDNQWAALWPLDPAVAFLNHGSYGACPREVLRHQADLRAEMEAEPVRFLGRDLDDRLHAARAALGAFVGADPDDLAFVSNATGGVNAVLRSLRLAPGDELLTTDHAYQACRNTLDFVAERSGARVVTVTLPFPVASGQAIVDTVMAGVTPRPRLALLDHITSPTALILPIRPLVAALAARGVE